MNKIKGVAITVIGLVLNLIGSALRDYQNDFNLINIITYLGIFLILLGAFFTYNQSKTYSQKFKASDYEPSTGTIVKVPFSKHKKKNPIAIIYEEVKAGQHLAYTIPTLPNITIRIEDDFISFHHPESFDGIVIIN